ncbi:MAG TPA: pyruvate kinase [Longimicrobiales bacterium]
MTLRTKIVSTIGPATAAPDKIHALAELGVDVFRLNFAHGTHEHHGRVIQWAREASKAVGKPIAILADLAGPKIRIGSLPEPVTLVERSTVVLAPEAEATSGELPTTYAPLAQDVSPGDRILLDDGLMELRVQDVKGSRVYCEVVRGGLLRSNKGMNLPGVRVSAPSLTEKDLADLAFAIDAGVDYIGLSFVQTAEDVEDLRRRIPNGTLIVAKIEKDTALENIEAILSVTDAVMVARGDLGVELPFERVPLAQKRIIQLANLYARPVITATQMLESMIENPRPTRAEASDVANALFDGTDAVMLSGETAAGRYPLLAVEAMIRIAGEIERSHAFEEGPKYDVPLFGHIRAGATPTEHAIASATVEAVHRLGAPAVVSLTRTGFTARLISSYRPPVPIMGVSDDERTVRQLALVWGVHPVLCRGEVSYENMLACARDYLLRNGIARPGDRVVVTAGVPFHVRGTTNLLRVEEL